MSVDVIVLNGGSSSGKSSLARRLQDALGSRWLTFAVDDLIRALPGADGSAGVRLPIDFLADGSVRVNDDFRHLEAAWEQGLATMARHGVGLIIDEVFLDGRASQERLARALSELRVLWVGVHCDPEVAAARACQRGDRSAAMARHQAELAHKGVSYDLVIDTTHLAPEVGLARSGGHPPSGV